MESSDVFVAEKGLEYYSSLQEKVGEEICRIARNYGKDSDSRKTPMYLHERLQQIETLWIRFDRTDSEIRGAFSKELSHPYFSKDYYHGVKRVAERTMVDIENRIQMPEEPQKDDRNTEDVGAIGGESGSETKHLGARPKRKVELLVSLLDKDHEEGEPCVGKISKNPDDANPQASILTHRERFDLLISILRRSLNKCSTELCKPQSKQFQNVKVKSL